eukprot:TRINITY_DN8358_c0_g1_i1.p1 TRINITY_DN8358_c0_g1~~TRINITY_DN8358_c0_g1_i1.p1  ORF type:complete len:282 (-),score=44.44 TRINITY_DN8358_c0_g1_i1:39-884(-)
MRIAVLLAIFHGSAEAAKLRYDTDGKRVAVFVQAANPSLWGEMQSCVENVAEGHTGPLDVFVSAVGSEARGSFQSSLEKSEKLKKRVGGVKVQVDVVENRGADIGQFLQQLQKIPKAPTTKPYDFVLKIHTKSDFKLRHWSLDSLCGSPGAVKKVMARFASDESLAMTGGKYMVLHWPRIDYHWVSGGAWHPTEIAAMQKAWPMLSDMQMPPVRKWTIVANSFYWVRGDQILEGELPKAIPALLASMPYGYKTGSSAQTSHALERLIPTMINSKGLKVEEV